METQAIKVDVNAIAWSQPPSLGFLSTVVIKLTQKTEEFLVYETDDTVSSLGSYSDSSLPDRLISLELSNFTPDNVFKHVFSQIHDGVLSELVSDRIAIESQRSDLRQGPLFVEVSVEMTHKSFIVVPSTSSVPNQSGFESDKCSICLENFSETDTDSVCQLPNCVHLFHETCLQEWLDRGETSCPLCRQDVNDP